MFKFFQKKPPSDAPLDTEAVKAGFEETLAKIREARAKWDEEYEAKRTAEVAARAMKSAVEGACLEVAGTDSGMVCGTFVDCTTRCHLVVKAFQRRIVVSGPAFPFDPAADAKLLADLNRLHPYSLSRWLIGTRAAAEVLMCMAHLHLTANARLVEAAVREVGGQSVWFMRRTGRTPADTQKEVK